MITIDFLGHATTIIEVAGTRLLTDPQLFPSFRHGLFGFFPNREIIPERLPAIDAIIISHSHRDHFDVRSLSILSRCIPVFCPADPRILHALSSLGYADVITVDDWSTVALSKHSYLLWTPSTYRVPEQGLFVSNGDVGLWNLVDTQVTLACIDELRARIARPPTAILAPCQPMLETHVVESAVPIPGFGSSISPAQVAVHVGARYAIPFADGHYCLGEASWLNHQKFPWTEEKVRRHLEPHCRVIVANPGDRIAVDEHHASVLPGRGLAVRPKTDPQDRSYHPGGWIAPVVSAVTTDQSTLLVVRSLLERAASRRGAFLQGFRERYGCFLRLSNCNYSFVVVDEDGRQAERHECWIDDAGLIASGRCEATDLIEVAVSASDLTSLSTGHLGYSAALLGGRLREFRFVAPGSSQVLSGVHEEIDDRRSQIVSGLCLLNLMLGANTTAALLEIDAELTALARGSDLVDLSGHPRIIPTTLQTLGDEETPEFWHEVENAIGQRFDTAAVYRVNADCCLVAPGRQLAEHHLVMPDCEVAIIIPMCLLEAQPHMGGGVRFPWQSYEGLLRWIVTSGVAEVKLGGLLSGVDVPDWRLAALLPYRVERLARDLSNRGWNGRISGGSRSRHPWWLGIPKLPVATHWKDVKVSVGKDSAVGIVSNGSMDGFPERLSGHDFRLEVDPNASTSLLARMITGTFRFSWLRDEFESAERFSATDVDSFAQLTERVCCNALASLDIS